MARFRKPSLVFPGGLFLIVVFLWLSFGWVERQFLRQLAVENDSTIRLVAVGLNGALKRFEALPALLADKTDMKWLLTTKATEVQIDHVNRELKKIAENFGASDIYVMDRRGITVSASNFDTEVSFIGQDFSYRPYFSEAISGRPAQFFALGTTSLKRGYYFTAPVWGGERILGVVAVKIAVDELEENWQGIEKEIFVSDKNGVLFMASEESWRFKSLYPLSRESLDEIDRTKQYPLDQLGEMNAVAIASDVQGLQLLSIGEEAKADVYLESRQSIPQAGWTLHVLAPKRIVQNQTYVTLAIAFLVLLVCLLIASIVLQRRARLIKNIELQKQTQEQLELRVSERTQALNAANRKLTREVSERTQTESRLRTTQNELIQAGKLAALGQMSAALSHELNQPLAAVKSYADNARAYLERNNIEKVAANIGHISEMVDRMAELGRHLRNFARKPQEKVDVVSLHEVFQIVNQIMGARLKEARGELLLDPFDPALMVKGGLGRLQQVMVNLINNALDAMDGLDKPVVRIYVEETADRVIIKVRDHGKGLSNEIIDHVFDPFFTTKGVNEGVGLGLSISYNIIRDFGGTLGAENHAQGGAVFTVSLNRVDVMRKAAE